MKVYILRHGETDWNKRRLMQGATDIPLNEKGIALAGVTAEGVSKDGITFDKIFSSPLSRALQTAQIVGKDSKVPVQTDERIREIGFGDFEGCNIDEVKNGADHPLAPFFLDTGNYKAPDTAEDLDHLFARISDFWQKEILPLEGKCESVLVSCHGAVSRAFMVYLHPLDRAGFWSNRQFNCSLNLVEVQDGKSRVLFENKIYYDEKDAVILPILTLRKEN